MMLVTGGNGHLGSHLVKILSEAGYNVRATVRNKQDESKTKPLKNLPKVELFEAELLDRKSLESAMEGIRVVFHAAAPNKLWSENPLQEIVDPIVQGTKNVFEAAHQLGVEKIIFTSSCSACGMNSSPTRPFDESHWNQDSTHPLLRSKISAETFAWDFSHAHQMNLITILPPLMIGPGFYCHTPSTRMYEKMLLGKFVFPPEGGCHLVDVRDVAQAQLQAALNPSAHGRYIVAGEFFKFSELIQLLQKIEPNLKLPSFQLPLWSMQGLRFIDWMLHKLTLRPRELTGEIIKDFVSQFQYVSTAKAVKDLQWNPRSTEQTIQETFQWIRDYFYGKHAA